ncbi:MAG: PEP-CTERM sorting domain-containing protein [Planctomycetes bacterium]|nr:PEP-CTERM sorting domain-containing protein [Planctomycetota bacterium]
MWLLVAAVALLNARSAIAGTKYWDLNGNTAGAGGATPTGTWDTGATANWTANSAGTTATTTWSSGDDAFFSAGTDATGSFTINVSGTNNIRNLTVEEGNVTLSGGTLNLSSNGSWDGGTGLIVSSALTFSNKLTIGGGSITLSGTNTGAGGVLMDAAAASLAIGNNAAFGTSTFEWGSGTLSATGGNRVIGSSVGVTTKDSITFSGSNDLTFNGQVTLGVDRNTSVTGAGRLTFAGGLTGGHSLIKLGTGTLAIGGTTSTYNYNNNTTVNQGTLLVNGSHSGGSNYSIAPTVAGNDATLGGIGTIGPLQSSKSISLAGATISSTATRAVLNPGDGGTNIGTLTVGTSGVNTAVSFGNLSRFAVDIDGGTADRLTINGNLTLSSTATDDIVFNIVNAPTAGKFTLLSYTGTKSDSGSTGFTTATGVPTGYRLSYANFNASNGTIDLIQGAVILPTATPTDATIITGGTTSVTVSVKNNAQTGGDSLAQFTVAAGTNVSGSSVSGGPLAPQASSGSVGSFLFNGTTVGLTAGSVSVSSTDSGVTSPVAGNFNVTVLNHSNGALALNTNNNQNVIVGATAATSSLSLTNAGASNAALDVNSLTSNLSGSTGTALVAANGSQSYTGTFNTGSVGLGQNQTFTATVRDTNLPGRGSAYSASAIGTINVYSHSAPTLTVAGGNNQSIITGGSLTAATATLSDTAGTTPAPLDVNTLSNLTGGSTVATGGTGTYTATGFDTTTVGLNKTLATSLKAGDQQTITGANALSTLSQNFTYTVYAHSNGALAISSNNNQNVIVGATAATIGLDLTNVGANNVALDVNSLTSNLSGPTGSAIVAANGSQSYSGTFNTSSIGLSQSQTFTATVRDTNLSGRGSAYNASVNGTVNVYNHSAPTLTIASGNNQSVIVNNALAAATATLANTAGTTPAPLDVNSLSNLSGSTGSGVVASGGSGTYTATGFVTNSTGIGKSLGVSLNAGDRQTITGANPLSPLSTSFTYNVYNHSTAALSFVSGNNQSAFVGGSLTNATFLLEDIVGTDPAPLDVNTLSNLTGSTGSGVVASGGTGTYTSTALDNSTAGIGKTLGVSLKAGDQQTITGANALSTLSQTITYNVYNHAAPTLTIAGGDNQSAIVNNALAAATATLSNTAGSVPAPLDVNTLSNLSGTTGSGVVASGGSGTYTATGFDVTTAGIGKTLSTSLKAGDQQSIAGANALSTLSTNFTYNVYNHSAPTLSVASGNNQSIITGGSLAAATASLSNTAGTTPAPLDVNTFSNLIGGSTVASGGTGTYTATGFDTTTVGLNKTLATSLKAGDQQTITGANALSTLSQNFTYTVYAHSNGALTFNNGDNQNVLENATAATAGLSLTNAGANNVALDVNSLSSNLSGSTGAALVSANGSESYSGTFDTSTVGLGQSQTFATTVRDTNLSGRGATYAASAIGTINVYAAALLTDNTNITLDSGSLVSIQNAAATPARASAHVDSVTTISPHWTLHNLDNTSYIAPGSGTPTANVTFDDTGLLNGQTLVGTLTVALENDQAIAGAADKDLGSLSWSLSHTVVNGVGNGTADVTDGESYADLHGVSDKDLASVATLLDGANDSGHDTVVEMTWRNRTTAEAGGFAVSLPSDAAGLVSDVVNLTGTDGTIFVLEMTVGPLANAGADVYLAWLDQSDDMWKLAVDGNHGPNTIVSYQSSWADAGSPLTLGAYGYDAANHKVWAVLDHNSDFAALELEEVAVPEPSTSVLAVWGLASLAFVAWRRRGRRQANQ